ncbi:MAG: cytochrome c biogenesis protein CcsA [Planctomycetota bacterium]
MPHRTRAFLLATACLLVACAAVWPAVSASAQARTQIDGNARAEPAPAPNANPEAAASLQQTPHDQDAHAGLSPTAHAAFAQALDLDGFRKLAVFAGGRVKIVDTLAREHLQGVTGRTKWKSYDPDDPAYAYDPVFMLLDMAFGLQYVDPATGQLSSRYADRVVLYVESTTLRRDILLALGLTQDDDAFKQQMTARRLTPRQYFSPPVQALLRGGDLTFMTQANQVVGAWNRLAATRPLLHLSPPLPAERQGVAVPPASEDPDRWLTLDEVGLWLAQTDALLQQDPTDAEAVVVTPIAQSADAELAVAASQAWQALAVAWRTGDAVATQTQLDRLVGLLPQLDPQAYPNETRRAAEVIYNKSDRYAFGWAAYAIGAVCLLLAAATRRLIAATLGSLLLAVGLLLHLANILTRTYLSGRWPIHNQYESFIAVAFFAVLVGAILMWARRQWVFGVAAGGVGAAALMFAHFLPNVFPSKSVANDMPILATSNILYVHVNVVLFSYGLIALAFGLSTTYLMVNYLGRSRAVAAVAAAGVGDTQLAETLSEDDAKRPATFGRKRLLGDLDTAQLLVMQLAFWLLGLGIILGAYWADHAWGRWWAWDPKETWALITWIVYLIAIHARFGVKNRGLVTAWLGVTGFFVMLWCYWGVNLLLSGLHSYA